MDTPSIIIVAVYVIGFIVIIALLIYLIFRRIDITKKGDFEDRSN